MTARRPARPRMLERPPSAALPSTLWTTIAWSSGSFPQTLVIYAFSTLIFRYLTDTVGIGAAVVGSVMAIAKFYDAAIDPAIG
jgi:Na+/melibiose symporter-like transporter